MAAKTDTLPEAQIIKITEWQDQLACFFRAQRSMFIQTSEEARTMIQLQAVIQYLGQTKAGLRDFFVWSACSHKKVELFLNEGNTALPVKDLGIKEFYEVVAEFAQPNETVPSKVAGEPPTVRHKAAVLVLCDPQDALSRPNNVRRLKETLRAISGWRKQIVIIGRPFTLPKDVETDLAILDMPLPTAHELEVSCSPMIRSYVSCKGFEGVPIDEASIKPFCRACAGVTGEEARGLIALSLAKYRAFDSRSVDLALQEKERIVKRSDVIESKTCHGDLSDVGGLINVKNWIAEITPILTQPEEARKYGLKLPSGALFCGVPGTGKSLCVEKIAAQWRLPLLCFDVGRCMAQWQGQSENNVREIIRIANACKPCVVMIDEIEKALGGSSVGQESGTTERVKATLLTWLQEKSDEIFVCATANNLRKLETMPELIRRFGEVFFVDLPDMRSRIEILGIHMRSAGHHVPADDLVEIAKLAKGYTGDECARVVQKALTLSFKARVPHPSLEHLLAAVRDIKPLRDTMKEPIAHLRQWAKEGRAKPAGATLEDDDQNDDSSYQSYGMPDLPVGE